MKHPNVKRYKYGDELTCRVCKQSTETVEHILCECTALVSHQCSKGDEYSDQLETLEEVIVRLEEFIDITEEQVVKDSRPLRDLRPKQNMLL